MWNRQSKSQSTVKEKPDEVQEIQNINARDNVAEPDAFEGKELTKKEQKAEKISLEVRASNEPARALYEKWGFKAVGLRRNFYKAPTEDAVLYDKILEQ